MRRRRGRFSTSPSSPSALIGSPSSSRTAKSGPCKKYAKRDVEAGTCKFTEVEVTKLWTQHAVTNRAFYTFPNGARPDTCFALLAAREPMVLRRIGLAKLAAWNDVDAARIRGGEVGPRRRAVSLRRHAPERGSRRAPS